jgi:hypothetical protein
MVEVPRFVRKKTRDVTFRDMTQTRWLRVPLPEIAYVRAIYEAYDGIGTLSAPIAARGELSLWVAPGQEALADEVERRLADEVGLQRIATPTTG